MKSRTLPEAQRDLESIWIFTAGRRSEASANKLIDDIVKTIGFLEKSPELGRARPEIREDIRCISVAGHIIFYKFDGKRLDVVRPMHGSRDLPAAFNS